MRWKRPEVPEVGRWVSFEGARPQINELPYFGLLDGDTLYHFGGPSHMTLSRDLKKLKDYGEASQDDAEELVFPRFYADHPPRVTTVEETLQLGCGWISPEGEVYGCHYGAHQGVAERLLMDAGVKHDGHMAGHNDHDDTLMRLGWLRLEHSKVYLDGDELTPRQVDALWELAEADKAAGNDGLMKEYLELTVGPPDIDESELVEPGPPSFVDSEPDIYDGEW